MIRAVMIPRIIPGAVQVIMNTKESVLSGKNLGNIFTQYAVIEAEILPSFSSMSKKSVHFFEFCITKKKLQISVGIK